MGGRLAQRAQRPPAAADWGVGTVRPVYFWAGASSARFHRLKFDGAVVDEAAHREGLTPDGAERLGAAGFNWAFLAANWGFPPELDAEDWDEFAAAVDTFHAHGIRVLAYIQASNCFDLGSYSDRGWFAITPSGRRIPYYAGRFMTCLHDPEWRDEVEGRIARALEAGTDGIYFDNVWMGATPWILRTAYGGFAGCACDRCRSAYREARGVEIPRRVGPEVDGSTAYLRWRADVVTRALEHWVGRARVRRPEVIVGANACVGVMRNAWVAFGIDYAAWSRALDFVLVEDVALPGHRRRGRREQLTQAAVTAKAARSVVQPGPLLTVSYDQGIGLDGPSGSRRYRQALAEAAACGTIGVVKGSEYLDSAGRFSLITAREFEPLRTGCGAFLDWLEGRADLFRGRWATAPTALLYPYPGGRESWETWAPEFFAAAQSLLSRGLPFRIIADREHDAAQLAGIELLVVPGRLRETPETRALAERVEAAGGRVFEVDPDLWSGPFAQRLPFTIRTAWRRRLLEPLFLASHRAYFTVRWLREFFHRSGLVKLGMKSPYFGVPREVDRFLEALRPPVAPRAVADVPILVEPWRRGDDEQLHLVNYGPRPTRARLDLHDPGRVTVIAPDHEPIELDLSNPAAQVRIDTYAIVTRAAVEPR